MPGRRRSGRGRRWWPRTAKSTECGEHACSGERTPLAVAAMAGREAAWRAASAAQPAAGGCCWRMRGGRLSHGGPGWPAPRPRRGAPGPARWCRDQLTAWSRIIPSRRSVCRAAERVRGVGERVEVHARRSRAAATRSASAADAQAGSGRAPPASATAACRRAPTAAADEGVQRRAARDRRDRRARRDGRPERASGTRTAANAATQRPASVTPAAAKVAISTSDRARPPAAAASASTRSGRPRPGAYPVSAAAGAPRDPALRDGLARPSDARRSASAAGSAPAPLPPALPLLVMNAIQDHRYPPRRCGAERRADERRDLEAAELGQRAERIARCGRARRMAAATIVPCARRQRVDPAPRPVVSSGSAPARGAGEAAPLWYCRCPFRRAPADRARRVDLGRGIGRPPQSRRRSRVVSSPGREPIGGAAAKRAAQPGCPDRPAARRRRRRAARAPARPPERDRGAAGGSSHHLRGHLGRVGADALGDHAVIAGRDDDRRGRRAVSPAAVDRRDLRRQLLQPAEAAAGLGLRVQLRRRRGDRSRAPPARRPGSQRLLEPQQPPGDHEHGRLRALGEDPVDGAEPVAVRRGPSGFAGTIPRPDLVRDHDRRRRVRAPPARPSPRPPRPRPPRRGRACSRPRA